MPEANRGRETQEASNSRISKDHNSSQLLSEESMDNGGPRVTKGRPNKTRVFSHQTEVFRSCGDRFVVTGNRSS
ncbi:hypothetical protein J6590_032964 [Homalodisca vitripennis]|nr:hypothetical protein J6590_032964 [Homalodisca vitripennis]